MGSLSGIGLRRRLMRSLVCGATIAGATIAGATIAGATIAGATIAGATVAGATIAGATVAGATVAGATVAGATVAGATVAGATVAGATVAGATVAGATVAGATVAGATVAGATVIIPVCSHAQLPARVDSTLHTLFASGTYAGDRASPARWRDDGTHYTAIERTENGSRGAAIIQYSAIDGGRQVLVSTQMLTPASSRTPLDVEDCAFSKDGTHVLIFTNSQRVWRQNTRGDFWVLDLRTHALHQVGAGTASGTLMFAKFSPDGSRVAYVHAGDLYVEPTVGGASTRLTHDATATLVNGMSDWVYEEEFDLRDGFRWSPDSKHIAFWQFDMSGVRDFTLINDTDSLYPVTKEIQYPKAGTTNSAVRVGVIDVNGGPVVWARLAGDPRDNYVPWMEWADSSDVVIQRMNRLQNTDDLLLASVATGATRTLNAMFRFPDTYKVGMAVAPVADQYLYDTIYEERYVGLPSTNAHGYDVGSPINFAEGLRGKLLIIHGSGDDNVHHQGTERLVNRLVSLGKQFDMMVYPNRTHCICEGAGTTLHVYSLLTRYLLTNLPPDKH